MTIVALVTLFAPVVAIALLLDVTRWPIGMPATLRYGLALGLGNNVGGTWFLLTRAAQRGPVYVIAGDAALLGGAVLLRWRLGRPASSSSIPWTGLQRGLLVAVAIAAAAAVAAFAINAVEKPHGEWDAWAIWNLRAVFDAAPNDYPLLWPSAVARVWKLAGEGTAAPLALAAALAAATALTLFGAVTALRDRTLGLLAVLCLLGTPAFVRNIAWQYADIPLAFTFLAALVLLALRDHDPNRSRGTLAWAGIAAGCAPLTKNEGILFLAVLLIVETGYAIGQRKQLLETCRVWAPFAVGLAPAIALLAVLKLFLAPSSDLLAGQSLRTYAMRLLDPPRYAIVARALAGALFPFGGPMIFALPAAALLFGCTDEFPTRRAAVRSAVVIALVATGYGVVYLIMPRDLAWQVSVSLERLMLQLWPSALFALFLCLRTPQVSGAAAREPRQRRRTEEVHAAVAAARSTSGKTARGRKPQRQRPA